VVNFLGILLFSLSCGALDYARGRGWSKLLAVVYGLWIGGWLQFTFTAPTWFALAFAGLFGLGATWGWGNPIGRALGGTNNPPPERWQFHRVLVDHIPLALAVRGLLWSLPTTILALWVPQVLFGLLIIPLAFMAAPRVAVKVFVPSFERWGYMEAVRGLVVGLGYGLVLIQG
jgi:hypothetical protein